MASRMYQPYKRGSLRPPGMALTNMLRGRTVGGQNMADVWRASAKLSRGGSRRKRPPRPQRPARPPRP